MQCELIANFKIWHWRIENIYKSEFRLKKIKKILDLELTRGAKIKKIDKEI